MQPIKPLAAVFISFLLLVPSGCGPTPPSVKSRSEAEKRLIDLCHKEYQLAIQTKMLSRTLYVYLPISHSIYDFKATADGPQKSKAFKEKKSIKYIDVSFNKGIFDIEYDFAQDRTYPQNPGFSTVYLQEFTEKRNNVFTAIYRAYADLEQTHSDAKNTPPVFVVYIIADIQKGMESTSLFAFEDFKRAMTQSIPYEEFIRRTYNDLTGMESIIGDTQGEHIDYHDISWPEFLAKQITQRVNFKYQHSDFPPDNDDESQILSIAAETFDSYQFTDFSYIRLHNVYKKITRQVGKEKILRKH